jgi:glucosamine-6-phosphate deaminase
LGLQAIDGKTILHTAPHHDDILLGYHAYAIRNLEKNNNHIVYFTNGAHGVSSDYVLKLLEQIQMLDLDIFFQSVYQISYVQCIANFAQYFHSSDSLLMQKARQSIFAKIIMELFGCNDSTQFTMSIDWVKSYCSNNFIDHPEHELIYSLKGRLRQSESDTKWFIVQGHFYNVTHLNSQFYYEPSDQAIEYDVQLFLNYVQKVKPNIVSIAMDPFGVGPATHFTTLQVVFQALQRYGDTSIEILGYRNVWCSFPLAKTSMVALIDQQEMQKMVSIFNHCFATQAQPLFPSPLYEGSFSQLSCHLQEHQLQDLSLLLGDSFHAMHPVGAIYLQKLTLISLGNIVRK